MTEPIERTDRGSDLRVPSTLKPIRAERFGVAEARHLLWRAGFGGTPGQVRALAEMGPEKAVELLVETEKTEFAEASRDGFDKNIMRPLSEEEQRAIQQARRNRDEEALAKAQTERQERERRDRSQIVEVQKWWLTRMIETTRPLEEKMTLFWHGLFATNYRSIENSYHMYQQNLFFRREGLSNYRAMLKGLIRDPAMLAYLNNNQSRKNKPNENLARELMELFSLGVGQYEEKDIKEGARALTGYTFRDDEFFFDQKNHDGGIKEILGQRGTLDGDGFVEAILARDACSRYIARRWYHFFVGDVPTEERGGEAGLDPAQRTFIHELARALREGDYAVRPALKKLFLSEHFYHPRFVLGQIKSPAVLVVGGVRSLGLPARDISILRDALDLMGQNLMFPPSVKGWDGGRSWINTSTLFVRQNVMTYLIAGKKPKGYDASAEAQAYDAGALVAGAEKSAEEMADRVLEAALGQRPSAARAALLAYLDESKGKGAKERAMGLLLLATAMPEYQLC